MGIKHEGDSMPKTCLPQVYLQPAVERRILNRLKRIEGQVRGVQRLIAQHHSCDDILIQVGALRQALGGVAVELLEGHMDTCVAESVERGQGATALSSLKTALAHVLRQV
jgi:CsoR family transcriptional regulator, copper-sensing transcriptional repressor